MGNSYEQPISEPGSILASITINYDLYCRAANTSNLFIRFKHPENSEEVLIVLNNLKKIAHVDVNIVSLSSDRVRQNLLYYFNLKDTDPRVINAKEQNFISVYGTITNIRCVIENLSLMGLISDSDLCGLIPTLHEMDEHNEYHTKCSDKISSVQQDIIKAMAEPYIQEFINTATQYLNIINMLDLISGYEQAGPRLDRYFSALGIPRPIEQYTILVDCINSLKRVINGDNLVKTFLSQGERVPTHNAIRAVIAGQIEDAFEEKFRQSYIEQRIQDDIRVQIQFFIETGSSKNNFDRSSSASRTPAFFPQFKQRTLKKIAQSELTELNRNCHTLFL